MTVKRKGGRPKGSGNLGIPGRMMTDQLHKALKQYERVNEKDPKKNIKRGMAVRAIMDHVVENAVNGEKWAIEFVTDRIEGKAVSRTETQHEIAGQVEHKGLQITFEAPRQLEDIPGEVIDERQLPG